MKGKHAFCFVAIAVLLASSALAQTPDAPQIPYESVPDFIKMPDGLYMGEAMGVATNSQGEFFVFTVAAKPRVCSSSTRPEISCVRSVMGCMGLSSLTP